MSLMLLTLYCADADAEAIAAALRDAGAVPVHLRRESVLGRDYGDAGARERVAGTLARTAIDVEVAGDLVADAVAAAMAARRRLPFRWRSVAIVDGGRVE